MKSIHKSRFLYEDEHLLAVHKLSGELVVKGEGKVQKLPLLDVLKQTYPGLQAMQRLDFETSGVVVFAKTKAAAEAIKKSKYADWKKTYRTLTMGRITKKKSTINVPLEARGSGKVQATTHYEIIEQFANSTYVSAEIETGRYHQIRKHFAAIRHPLVMDHVYGNKKHNKVFRDELGYKTFFLHAFSVDLIHPMTGEELHIESPLPKVFVTVLKRLRTG